MQDRFYDYRRPPRETTGDKLKKVAKTAGKVVVAGGLVTGSLYGAVKLGPPAVDAAGQLIGQAGEKIGLIHKDGPTQENNATSLPSPTSTPIAPTPTSEIPLSEFTKTPTAIPTPEVEDNGVYLDQRLIGGYTFYIDTEGMPGKWTDSKGETHIVTPAEKQQLLTTQKLARESNEPQIAQTFTIEEKTPPPTESPDHPTLTELPPDVLSAEELQKRNITVVQDPNNPVFFIRQTAFDKGMPLADFAEGKERLEYFIIDAPYLSDAVIPDDPKYQHAKDALINKGSIWQTDPTVLDIPSFKESEMNGLKQNIIDTKNKLQATTNPGEKELYNGELLQMKSELDQLASFTDDEWRWYDLSVLEKTGKDPAGLYWRTLGEDGKTTYVIVLAVGKEQKSPDEFVTGFDSSGRFIISSPIIYDMSSAEPRNDQSYPDPSKFPRNPNATQKNQYPIGAASTGFANAHELAGHYALMDHRMNTIDPNDPKYLKPDGTTDWDQYLNDTMPNQSEYDADMNAYAYMKTAWDYYQATGKDIKYGFVFRTPSGKYIITENQPKPSNNATWLGEKFFPEQKAAVHDRQTANPDTVVALADKYTDRTVTQYRVDKDGKLIEVGNPVKQFGDSTYNL